MKTVTVCGSMGFSGEMELIAFGMERNLIREIKDYRYLEENILGISKKYHLSASRLSHIFKEYTGVSLKGYLNMKQMQYAYMLAMGGKSITDAALEAGFFSAAHLAVSCKKQMGVV